MSVCLLPSPILKKYTGFKGRTVVFLGGGGGGGEGVRLAISKNNPAQQLTAKNKRSHGEKVEQVLSSRTYCPPKKPMHNSKVRKKNMPPYRIPQPLLPPTIQRNITASPISPMFFIFTRYITYWSGPSSK